MRVDEEAVAVAAEDGARVEELAMVARATVAKARAVATAAAVAVTAV